MRSATLIRLRDVLSYLPAQQFRGMWLLLIISTIVGFADLVFVGLTAKLVGSLSGSNLSDNLPFVRVFGGDSLNRGLWIVGILIVLIWFSTGLKFLAKLIEARVSAEIWSGLGNRIYVNLLLQSFDFFSQNHSARLLTRLNRVLNKVSDSVVLPVLAILANTLSSLILVVGVIVAFGWVALALFGMLVVAYSLASALTTPRMRFLVKQRFLYFRRVNELFLESTRSIRDIHLHGAEPFFVNRFHEMGSDGKRYDRMSKILPTLPRFVIEPAGVTLIFGLGLLPVLLSGAGKEALRDGLPALVGIMFAVLRLSAPIQQVSRAVNRLRGSLPDLDDALDLLRLEPSRLLSQDCSEPVSPAGIMPRNTIKLESVSYRYSQDSSWALKDIDLTIPVGARVALVGSTGGGKTTAAHLLLGLLTPQKGNLLLDGLELSQQEVQAWQQCCAFVPQNINLLDSSVRDNVAFGIDDVDIDEDAVWDCLEMAQLAEFVSDLPYGVFTRVGEDGIRFSGGQRQRLALARAFYKRARVLILDEATSALDNKTESDVMDSLELIARRCTTIVIAHRLSTIRYCDRIYEFRNAEIVAYGTYEQLQNSSSSFKELVNLSNG